MLSHIFSFCARINVKAKIKEPSVREICFYEFNPETQLQGPEFAATGDFDMSTLPPNFNAFHTIELSSCNPATSQPGPMGGGGGRGRRKRRYSQRIYRKKTRKLQ
jgi:hypothetical protein